MMRSPSKPDVALPEWNKSWLKPVVWIGFCTVLLPLTVTAILSGKSSTEKMLTSMAQPLFVAIVAAMAIGATLLRRGERPMGWLLVIGACILWCVSSGFVVERVFSYWESGFESIEPSAIEPFDYVVVLGGGTGIAPDGRAQFGGAGDRVGYAAQLFLAGKAKNLVTTGDTLVLTGILAREFEAKYDPSEQTRQIWKDLGIPGDVIFELPGQNTSSEMAALKERPEWWKDKRCGLITSAFHMPRALKLAEQAGVQVSPIGADYRAGRGPFMVQDLMPNIGVDWNEDWSLKSIELWLLFCRFVKRLEHNRYNARSCQPDTFSNLLEVLLNDPQNCAFQFYGSCSYRDSSGGRTHRACRPQQYWEEHNRSRSENFSSQYKLKLCPAARSKGMLDFRRDERGALHSVDETQKP